MRLSEMIYTEEEMQKLRKENKELKKENEKLKVIIENNDSEQKDDWKHIEELEEANKKLHEICDKYVPMALRLEDENKRLNEDFGRYKKKVSEDMEEIVKEQTENIKLFDTIKGEYKKLEKENKSLKEERDSFRLQAGIYFRKNNDLDIENKRLRADYIKLSKIVETTGGYKASYVNELRDKIAKLEFDIEALKKLKYGQEEEIIIPIYDEEGKLVMKH